MKCRVCALVLFGVGVVAVQSARPADPVHDGKRLSEWVALLDAKDAKDRAAALDALTTLGGRSDELAEALLAAGGAGKPGPSIQVYLLAKLGPRAVPAATAALWSADENVRGFAARVLAAIGEDARSAAPALVRLLKSPDFASRAAAVEALRAVGATSAIPALTKLLTDPDEDVRFKAAAALAGLGADPEPVVPVLVAFLDSKVEKRPEQAAVNLGLLGPEAAAAVPSLVAKLPGAGAALAERIAEALGRIGPGAKDAVPALKNVAAREGNDFAAVRIAACVALWQIARDPDATRLLRVELAGPHADVAAGLLWRTDAGPETAAALEKVLNPEKPELAVVAAGVLGAKSKDAVPLLGKLLAHKEANVRARAVVALVQLGPDAKPALEQLRAATKDDAPYIAFWAAALVARFDPKAETVAAVAGYLGDANADLHRSAADILGRLGAAGKAATARLTAALTDPDSETRMLAARALWKVEGNPTALPALVEGLKDADPNVRNAFAAEIGATFGPEAKPAVPALVKRLFDPFASVRSSTAEALGRVGPAAKDAVPALLSLLDGDEASFVVSAACEAIGLIGTDDADAPAALKKKLDHPDALTRAHAALALARLGGDKSGEKVAAKLLGYRTYQVRITAAEALWRMSKDERAVPVMLRSLEEGNLDGLSGENERYMAARALGRVGPAAKSAVPALTRLLNHHDPALAETARDAIKAIEPEQKK